MGLQWLPGSHKRGLNNVCRDRFQDRLFCLHRNIVDFHDSFALCGCNDCLRLCSFFHHSKHVHGHDVSTPTSILSIKPVSKLLQCVTSSLAAMYCLIGTILFLMVGLMPGGMLTYIMADPDIIPFWGQLLIQLFFPFVNLNFIYSDIQGVIRGVSIKQPDNTTKLMHKTFDWAFASDGLCKLCSYQKLEFIST